MTEAPLDLHHATVPVEWLDYNGHMTESAYLLLAFARIGVMRALNRGHVREFNSTRKETQWGKRKLKRDQ